VVIVVTFMIHGLEVFGTIDGVASKRTEPAAIGGLVRVILWSRNIQTSQFTPGIDKAPWGPATMLCVKRNP
jgi:hypothetical protein